MTALTLCAFLQLELLEEQRYRVRSRKAFSIQCYWRRHQRHQRAIRTKCATFIQAGTYNLYNIQYQLCYLEHYWFGPVNWSVLLFS